MRTIEDLAQRFDSDRRHLRSVAFHLLGSAADAEDAVQSAWLKASGADHGTVENLTNWFTTITAREADRELVPDDVPTVLRGAKAVAEETRRFAVRARAGAVVLVNGVPGIAIAPAGNVQALLQIGIEDGRIATIDIVGGADRLQSAVLALPQ
jgi:hypothetical protein